MDKPHTRVKILVVDDNPKNIQVIGTFLREGNFEIGFALDGQQALDMLKDSYEYDLVLLDITMPVMNGYEVCSMMKQDERLREIPVIFLSASHEMENIIAAFDAGGVDYVTKPFNGKELLARVNTHLLLKQKTLEVTRYAQELEKLNATKDKFFSIIAHDLRNPFEGILLVCKALRDNLQSLSQEEVSRHLDLVIQATEGGYKLLENLLIWSKSQTGKLTYKPTELDPEILIRRVLEIVGPQAVVKNIRVEYNPGETGQKIMTDEAMFCHILRNLMSNAIKFTKSGGTVTIQTDRRLNAFAVSVIDDGIGISKADKSCLFRIDGKVSSRPGTSNEAGSGLGLILCKEFIDKMGGSICARSEPGKGSKFTFVLPQL